MGRYGDEGGAETTTDLPIQLRRASFILPKTGERSKRQFTLRDASARMSQGNSPEQSRSFLNGDSIRLPYDEGEYEEPTRWQQIQDVIQDRAQRFRNFAVSPTGQGIFKCSIGYLLGSMATLIPSIAKFFGDKQDSKHLVATVTVYFHAARTVGSMHEATVLALMGFLYAAFLSFSSMGVSIFFAHQDLIVVGHAIVLVVFVAGGFGLMAYVKQRLGNPLVNVAISLASLGSITILLREGSIQAGSFSYERITQVLGMVILGIIIASVVNFVIFPTLARKKLSEQMEKNTDLLGEMLISITRAFLHGREQDLEDDYFKTLAKEHASSLNVMKKNLNEAKKEHYVLGDERLYRAQAKVVSCLAGLSQDLGGLRSAALAQFAFLHEQEQNVIYGRSLSPVDNESWIASPTMTSPPIDAPAQNYRNLAVINEVSEGGSAEQSLPNGNGLPVGGHERTTSDMSNFKNGYFVTPSGTATPYSTYTDYSTREHEPYTPGGQLAKSPGDMFVAFISQLGPPTKSLVYTVKQVLDELPFKEVRTPGWNPWTVRELEVAVSEQFHDSLRDAVELYREERKHALSALYQNRAISAAVNAQHDSKGAFGTRPQTPGNHSPVSVRTDRRQNTLFDRQPEEVLADIEEVSACCGHFSFALLDFAEDVLNYLNVLDELKIEMESPRRSWNWLKFWQKERKPDGTVSPRASTYPEHNEEPDSGYKIPEDIRKADRLIPTTHSFLLDKPWYYGVYRAFRWIRRDDVRFAIKVGLGAALYALPAFLRETRPFFLHWRGEWGLVSYMVVCSMTVGATNTTGFNRIWGTIIGAVCATLAWLIANHDGVANPYILGFCGWLMSLYGFYVIVGQDNGPMGRFIILTYNLSALYSYSLSINDNDNDDDEGGVDPAIWEIVLHRTVSVTVGTIWAIIVCRWIAPISARHKLREGLCLLWLRMGLIWKRDPLALLLLGEPASAYMDIREEAELVSFLGNLRSLRKAASAEFEFQGPFPDKQIGNMLDRAGRMLDAFHAMNVVISKNLQATPGEAAVLKYTRPERFALSARISHLFTVLASSIKLEYPLNDVLPKIDDARDRLLAKISEYRRTGEGRELTTEQDYEMLYAYVLVTGQLAKDIEVVGQEVEGLYGTLNEDNLNLH
ncbi:hypothetical protein CB0940_10716 [Cercospora beticola]|uniref:Integral membrane bound transporter domain-containing protein n=1 Tax=Cercospora beticola TaxID=122368 RepID=A0A2G5HTR6_CERBT|nr:hypothetical protein CB0940_10716 [Cercospora beticola]PIA95683.1 hypothetical protein CB0940_10716 [Cercospora beticola]WPB07442.1 hypothetical protein RHO25_012103 [Cercospora beticola]